MLREQRLDRIMFFEDSCGSRGPIIGPAAYEEFFSPGYRKAIGGLREMGVRHFFIDSDGDARRYIRPLMACGATAISPCEVAAGMDAEELRRAHPALGLWGGIDKRALTHGPAEIETELRRRFAVAWRRGRYFPHLDHGAPPDISWENIQFYARKYVEYCAAPL